MWHIGRGPQQDTTCDMSHVSHLGMLGGICPARSASRTPRRRIKVPLPLVDSTCRVARVERKRETEREREREVKREREKGKNMLYLTSIGFSACVFRIYKQTNFHANAEAVS